MLLVSPSFRISFTQIYLDGHYGRHRKPSSHLTEYMHNEPIAYFHISSISYAIFEVDSSYALEFKHLTCELTLLPV